MAYRLGFCPQCNQQIMGTDLQGKFCSRFPNFREADMVFEDGYRVRTIICEGCLNDFHPEKMTSSILEEGSQLSEEQRRALTYKFDGGYGFISDPKGLPLRIENRTR